MSCFSRVVLATACGLAAIATSGSVSSGADWNALMKSYGELKANSERAIQAGQVETVQAQIQGQKVSIVGQATIPPGPPIVPNGPPLRLGVRVWAELANPAGQPTGVFVNLEKHKWQRMERFFLCLETAVPVQLSFFQNYPDGRPPSRQISPDLRFPATFATIMPTIPGVPFYRCPVLLQMDDDLRDELISIIVVRADAQVLPINGAPLPPPPAVGATAAAQAQAQTTTIIDTNTIPPGSQIRIDTRASAASLANAMGQGGVLKSKVLSGTTDLFANVNKASRTGPLAKSGQVKMNFIAPPPVVLPPAPMPFADVAIVFMGPGNIGQIELVFHKD